MNDKEVKVKKFEIDKLLQSKPLTKQEVSALFIKAMSCAKKAEHPLNKELALDAFIPNEIINEFTYPILKLGSDIIYKALNEVREQTFSDENQIPPSIDRGAELSDAMNDLILDLAHKIRDVTEYASNKERFVPKPLKRVGVTAKVLAMAYAAGIVPRIMSLTAKSQVSAVTQFFIKALSIARLFDLPKYQIKSDFFNEFSRVSLKGLRGEHLPVDMSGLVRLPVPLVVNSNKLENALRVDEFLFCCSSSVLLTRPLQQNSAIISRGGDIAFRFVEYDEKGAAITISAEERQKLPKMFCIAWKQSSLGKQERDLPEEFRMFATDVDSHIQSEKDYTYKVIRFYIPPSADMEEVINESYNDDAMVEIESSFKGGARLIRTLLNLIIYIASGEPDIRKHLNKIRYQNKKERKNPVFEDKDLTEDEVFLVGYNWKKLPSYSKEEWTIKPHMGWRWYGPGKKQIRLTFIKGSKAKRQKVKITQENTECQNNEQAYTVNLKK